MIKIIYDDERETKIYDNLENALFENLINKSVDFNKLTQEYVRYLQSIEYLHTKQLSEIDLPLINVIKPMSYLKGTYTKDSIYRYLVKYERFKGSPVWEGLVKYVEENNINLEGSYMCDMYKKGDDKNE